MGAEHSANTTDQGDPVSTAVETAPAQADLDPAERLRALAGIITAANGEIKKWRVIRNAAALSALLDWGAKPVDCYSRAGINRNAFAVLRRDAEEEAAQGPQGIRIIHRERYPSKDAALQAIEDSGRRIQDAQARLKAARVVRDNVIVLPMLHAEVRRPDGGVWKDAEIAEMSGLTSARIAQIKVSGGADPAVVAAAVTALGLAAE